MDYSLPGLLGAFLGTVLGVINYAVIIGFVTGRLRARAAPKTDRDRAELEHTMSWVRQLVLAADIVIFAAIGYWLGQAIGG
jgi:hypothetical protein